MKYPTAVTGHTGMASAAKIFTALTKHAGSGSSYMYRYVPEALVAPSEGVALNYKDLLEQVTNLSQGLIAEGFGPNTSIAASFPNVSANVTLQLACAITGTSFVTCKDPNDLSDTSTTFNCHGTTSQDFSWLLKSAGKNTSTALKNICIATEESQYAFYNGSAKETTIDGLVSLASMTAAHFNMHDKDTIVVPVSLNHTMGMAFGVLPGLLSGGAVVLPSPTPDPERVVQALREQQATLLIADTHLVAKVNELGANETFHAFRGGLVKVGSGEAISTEEVREVLNVKMDTVGVVKK